MAIGTKLRNKGGPSGPPPPMSYVEVDRNSAVAIIAEAMMAYNRYVKGQHGTCNSDTMENMFEEAKERYNAKLEREA